jgi:hypothetical protein
MFKIKTLLIVALFAFFMFLSTLPIKASEGYIEMGSTINEPTRCWAASVLMQDEYYNIIVDCRDLIYPVDTGVYVYAVWANPVGVANSPFKLGELGMGRAFFKTKTPFSSIYVTTENPGYRNPSNRVVMRGNVQNIDYLNSSNTTITQSPTTNVNQTPTPTIAATISAKDRILLGLRRAGIVALVALIAIIGLVFVITRSKG